MFWGAPLGPFVGSLAALAAKIHPNDPYPSFGIGWGAIPNLSPEAVDPTIQFEFIGVKNPPFYADSFVRNNYNNVLLDPNQNPVTNFLPIIANLAEVISMNIVQQQNQSHTGNSSARFKGPNRPAKNHL